MQKNLKDIFLLPFKKLIYFILPQYFNLLEKFILTKVAGPIYPPIFVIGAPRSGTTLMYQLLVNCFEVSYICNRVSLFYKTPAGASLFWRNVIKKRSTDFTNYRGVTRGVYQPSSAVTFWKRWFPKDNCAVDETYFSEEECGKMRKQVAAIESILGGPFVGKYQELSCSMRAVSKVFPTCLFVWMKRDPLDGAYSLWKTRLNLAKNGESAIGEWWSAKPKEYESIKNKPLAQKICLQRAYIEKNIVEDIKVIGIDRVLEVQYESLCKNPAEQLFRVQDFVKKNGGKLKKRSDLPSGFTFSTYKDKKDSKIEELSEILTWVDRLIQRG